MSWDRWWLFVVTVFLISGTPGPNMLHVMMLSVRHGFVRSIWAMAGCMSAVLLALAPSGAGVGAVLLASPRLFDALRYASTAYLAWLVIKAWRGADTGVAGVDPAAPPPCSCSSSAGKTAGRPSSRPFVAVEVGWYVAYVAGGRGLAGLRQAPALFDRANGSLFFLFGAGLIAARA